VLDPSGMPGRVRATTAAAMATPTCAATARNARGRIAIEATAPATTGTTQASLVSTAAAAAGTAHQRRLGDGLVASTSQTSPRASASWSVLTGLKTAVRMAKGESRTTEAATRAPADCARALTPRWAARRLVNAAVNQAATAR